MFEGEIGMEVVRQRRMGAGSSRGWRSMTFSIVGRVIAFMEEVVLSCSMGRLN
jgi:hypothetical protein